MHTPKNQTLPPGMQRSPSRAKASTASQSPGEAFLSTYCPPKLRRDSRRNGSVHHGLPPQIAPSTPVVTSNPEEAFTQAEVDRRRIELLSAAILTKKDTNRHSLMANGGLALRRMSTARSTSPSYSSQCATMPNLTVSSAVLKTYQSRSYTMHPCFMCGESFDVAALAHHHAACETNLNDRLRDLGRHPFCGLVSYPTSSLVALTGDSIPGLDAPLSTRVAYASDAARAYGGFKVLCKGCGRVYPVAEALEHFWVCGVERSLPLAGEKESTMILGASELDQTALYNTQNNAITGDHWGPIAGGLSPVPTLGTSQAATPNSISTQTPPVLMARYPSASPGTSVCVPEHEKHLVASTVLPDSAAYARAVSVVGASQSITSQSTKDSFADPMGKLISTIAGNSKPSNTSKKSVSTSSWKPPSPSSRRTSSPSNRQSGYDAGWYINTRLTRMTPHPTITKPSIAELASCRSVSPTRGELLMRVPVGGLTGLEAPRQARSIICAPRASKSNADVPKRW